MLKIQLLKALVIALVLTSCNSEPKVIEGQPVAGENPSETFQSPTTDMMSQEQDNSEHKVVVEEILDTDKYNYLRVKENGEEFWIAVSKQEVKIGGTYIFQRGLLKKNFQSREYDRVFETLYLVSDFRPADAETAMSSSGQTNPHGGSAAVEAPKNITPAPGAIKIADLVANLSKYEGKTVKVTGKVMKLNAMIMGRNWVHLQDGSAKGLDLTVTTTEPLQVGQTVTMEGTIALNKDFGAGYKYDYIMEGAVVK